MKNISTRVARSAAVLIFAGTLGLSGLSGASASVASAELAGISTTVRPMADYLPKCGPNFDGWLWTYNNNVFKCGYNMSLHYWEWTLHNFGGSGGHFRVGP